MPTTTPLDELAGRTETYAKELHKRFFRVLSREDCADVVQDVFLAAAESETCQQLNRYKLEAWIRRAAQHRALDVVKDPHHLGQATQRRAARLDIADFAEVLAAEAPDETDDTHMKALLAAFARLPAQQQQILGLRHLDNLTREACARVMSMSVMTFRRSHDDAVRRLIDLVVQTRPHDTCAEARALIHLSVDGHLEPESTARLDAHLEGCAHCHHYRRRSRGLLVFLPLPAVSLADRFSARLHVVVERLLPAAQGADPSVAAGTAGGGAAALGGAKLVAVLAAGAVAVGGPIAAHRLSGHDTARAAVPSPPVAATTSTTSATSPAGSMTYTYAARPSSHLTSPSASTHSSRTGAAKTTRRKTGTSSLGELKPSGHEVAPTATSSATPPVPQAVATPAPTSHKTTTKSAPAAVPAAPLADSSSGEFAPHP